MDVVIPSLTDPSIAPPGKHVMTCFVQYAPYHLTGTTWDDEREAFGDTVIDTLSEYAPNLKSLILHRQVITPLDLEREWGLSEGNIFQGELALEQLLFLRPVPGWAKYRTPIRNLFMCGSATHPGGGIMGAPGRNAAHGNPQVTDVIFVGGGHNGLTAATVTGAQGRQRRLVLERQPVVGGAAITSELHPGFRISTLAHAAQPAAALLSELKLADHGLELIDPNPYLFAPLPDGRSLVLGHDEAASAASIRNFSVADARRYQEFCSTIERIRAFVSHVMATTPPEIEQPSSTDLWSMLMMGRRFRGLGKKDAYSLLRWAPMSAADFVSEWFESEPLRAAIAAGGIFGTAFGPRSAGSTAVLLLRMSAGDGRRRLVRGGLGALTSALAAAARSAGVPRFASMPRSIASTFEDGRATGVTLHSGEEL